MLSKEFFAAIFLIFLLATILGGIMTASSVGEEEESMLQTIMSPLENFARFTGITWVAGVFPFPKVEFPWLSAMWNAITLDTALFEGIWGQYVKWALWMYFGVALIFGLGMWLVGVIRGSG